MRIRRNIRNNNNIYLDNVIIIINKLTKIFQL